MMNGPKRQLRFVQFSLAVIAVLALSAGCSSLPSPVATPSPTSTFTPTSTLPPTETQTLASTLPPPSPTASSGVSGPSACDSAAYVSDVTIPDGTQIDPGAKFVKTWMLQNTGTCAWDTSYKLAYVSGDQMSGADVFLESTVQSGQQISISVNLVAPMLAGDYKGFWRMQNGNGQGFGHTIFVEISVAGAASAPACYGVPRKIVTISGHAGPEKVTIDYGSGATVTDAQGNYSFNVPSGWSGTVIPSKAKVHPWTFDPDHRTYINITCDLNHEDYKATAPPGT